MVRGGHSVSVDLANCDVSALSIGIDPLSLGDATIELVQTTGLDVLSNLNTSILVTTTGPWWAGSTQSGN